VGNNVESYLVFDTFTDTLNPTISNGDLETEAIVLHIRCLDLRLVESNTRFTGSD